MDQAKAEMLERSLALAGGTYVGATVFGVPVTDLTAWLMLLYAILLILWHLKTKWLKRWWP